MTNLDELKARVKYAHYKGYKIAYAEDYAADLGGGPPPIGVEPYSTAHLLHLIEMKEMSYGASRSVEVSASVLADAQQEVEASGTVLVESVTVEAVEPDAMPDLASIVMAPKKGRKSKG